jgi:hypothetical protein
VNQKRFEYLTEIAGEYNAQMVQPRIIADSRESVESALSFLIRVSPR